MSYCRWSSDSFRCDIYAYESNEGFEVHVATRRHTLPEDVQAPSLSLLTEDIDAYHAQHRAFLDALDEAEWEPIGLPYDGERYCFDTEDEMFACFAELAHAGYRVPEHLLQEDPS